MDTKIVSTNDIKDVNILVSRSENMDQDVDSELIDDEIDSQFFGHVAEKLSNIEVLLQQIISNNLIRKAAMQENRVNVKADLEESVYNENESSVDSENTDMEEDLNSTEFEFPIKSINDLMDLDTQIVNDSDTASHMKSFLDKLNMKRDPYSDMTQVLNILVSDDVLCKMDWDGFHNKVQMSQFVIFSKTLFDSWKRDKLEYSDFEQIMRKQIRKAYKRHLAL